MDQDFINWAKTQLDTEIVVTKAEHGDQSAVYQLDAPRGKYFLKIGSGLASERERLEWLDKKLPVPKVIGFINIDGKDVLLLSVIEGMNLAALSKEWPAEKIIDKLVAALHQFHAVDIKGCPFGTPSSNKVLIHGDACLPNFIFKGDKFSGYIDLGDMRIDAREVDLSATIWSLQYNLGQGHGIKFLEKYGLKDVTAELVEKLRVQYEEMQEKRGLI